MIGAGPMGAFHARTIAASLPQYDLRAVVDPDPKRLVDLTADLEHLNRSVRSLDDPAAIWDDRAVAAVVIAAPPAIQPELIATAARAGKAIFCEKPAGLTGAELEPVVTELEGSGTILQIGFNRRFDRDFAAARAAVINGDLGRVVQVRSLTRDPAPLRPETIKPNAIFIETLVHDFDYLCWLLPHAEVGEISAYADALIRPDWRDRGLLDTASVSLRFSDGTHASAEACLETAYGYDVRAEILGTAGMLQVGGADTGNLTRYTSDSGRPHSRRMTGLVNISLFADAYRSELVAFHRLSTGVIRPIDDSRIAVGADALRALRLAERAIASI